MRPARLPVVVPGCAGPDDPAGDPFDHTVDIEDLDQRLQPGSAEVHRRFQGRQVWRACPGPSLTAARTPAGMERFGGRPTEGQRTSQIRWASGAGEQPRLRPGDRPPGPADLLVVGDRRRWGTEAVDEGHVGLVDAHPQGARRHHDLDVVGFEIRLEPFPLLGRRVGRVGASVDPPGAEEVGHEDGVGHGEAVDDPGAGHGRDPLGQPAEALGEVREAGHAEVQRLPFEWAPQDEDVVAELVGDIGAHPGVGGGGGGQDRRAGRQVGDGVADAAVVGAEVVAPVGDAVSLVDDEETQPLRQAGQDPPGKAGGVEPLGADGQQVDLAGGEGRLDGRPLVRVGGVDRRRSDTHAAGGGDLIAHQGQQRRHDQGGSGPGVAEQAGGDEVDGRLPETGALDHQRPSALPDHRFDGGRLVGSEHGVGTGQLAEQLAGPLDEGVRFDCHPAILPDGCDVSGPRRLKRPDQAEGPPPPVWAATAAEAAAIASGSPRARSSGGRVLTGWNWSSRS